MKLCFQTTERNSEIETLNEHLTKSEVIIFLILYFNIFYNKN